METAPLEPLARALLALVPADGTSIGNKALRRKLAESGTPCSEEEYAAARDALIAQGSLAKGRGKGGSVRRAQPSTGEGSDESRPYGATLCANVGANNYSPLRGNTADTQYYNTSSPATCAGDQHIPYAIAQKSWD